MIVHVLNRKYKPNLEIFIALALSFIFRLSLIKQDIYLKFKVGIFWNPQTLLIKYYINKGGGY